MSDLNDKSLTIAEFCEAEGISNASYYKMKRKGLGPREMRVPGTSIVRISFEARRDFRLALEAAAQSPQALKQARAKAAQTSAAGKIAVVSSGHPRPKRATEARS